MSPNQLVRDNDAKAIKAIKNTLKDLNPKEFPDNYEDEEAIEERYETSEW